MIKLLGMVILGIASGITLSLIFLAKIVKFKTRCSWHRRGLTMTGWIGLNILKKISVGSFFESMQRAESGKSLYRPFGRPEQAFDFSHIQFSPKYIKQRPLEAEQDVQTAVMLGPKAKKPLKLDIPILLGGMASYSALTLDTMVGMAKGASLARTAVNTGNGPFLPKVRRASEKYVLQLGRGFWSRETDLFQQSDLIELGLGHSAWASAPIRIKGFKVTAEFAQYISAIPGLDLLIDARLPEVESRRDLVRFIRDLKSLSGGVPIAVKFGCSHYIEKELEIIVEAGADMIVFDGLEGGTHGSPPIFQDDLGLPLFPGVCRALAFLETKNLRDRVSLVVGGGLVTPGHFLKCLALGADAVMIGTIAALAIVHTQVTKVTPWEPPTQLLYAGGSKAAALDPAAGGRHLGNYLDGCVREMKTISRILGKDDLQKIDKTDLVALDPLYAKIGGLKYLGEQG